jgi:hypothetical protein
VTADSCLQQTIRELRLEGFVIEHTGVYRLAPRRD